MHRFYNPKNIIVEIFLGQKLED